MLRPPGLTVLLLFAAAAFAQNEPIDTARIYSAENHKNEFVPGEFIVAFKPGALDFANQGMPILKGLRSRRDLAIARKPHSGTRAYTGRKLILLSTGGKTRDSTLITLQGLRQDSNVAYVEPNYLVHSVNTPNDSSFSLLWGMQNTGQTGGTPHADIDATDAWNRTQGNPNLLIGIIDTGIDYLHPDLAANIWTNPGEIAGNGVDDDDNGYVDDIHGYNFVNNTGDPMDDNDHGTHVAGTIAAVGNNGMGVAGVVWRAKLVALKFLDSTGSGTTAGAIDAMTYANAMGISITNNSWGGSGFSQALKNVIDAANVKGYLFIAAAGNNGTSNETTPFYPSGYTSSNIIAVAATDDNDALASFSNYGPISVDLAAPGVNIYSTKPGNSYQYLSGTSMATPHVTGSAALIWGYNPALTSVQVKNYLLQGVDSIAALNGKVLSAGRLNVYKALNLALPPIISYKVSILAAVKKSVIVPDTAVSTGGSITGYAMSPFTPLPAGLALSATTGIISGTPTVVFSSANDTIIATGPNGKGRGVVNITVQDTAPKISYKRTTISAVKNTGITPDTVVSSGGAVTSYAMSVSTPLPAGLTLSSTGTLSGTPTGVSALAVDTIIATGPGGTGEAEITIGVADTSPAFSYRHASLSGTRNVPIPPDTVVVTGTGVITSYAMSLSTPLPAGLSLNTVSGLISGTPTGVSPSAVDTIIATGPGGTGKATVTLVVQDTVPRISYRQASISGVKHVVIVPDTVVSSGGAVTSYTMSVSTPLPAGLTLGSAGIITGTPTAVSALAVDTVIATGPGGTGEAAVAILVADTSPAFSYKHASLSGTRNIALSPDTVVVTGTGAITGYAMSISTPLPAGLSLNAANGIISGTPTVASNLSMDTVIATGPGGTGKAVVTLSVQDTAPKISYRQTGISGVKHVAIVPDTMVSAGGAVTAYAMSVSTPLPAGLSLNTANGIISGTPTGVFASALDTVIATGPGGIGEAFVTIGVLDTAPAFAYERSNIFETKNVAILSDSVMVTGTGAITGYALSVSTPLPAGLSLNTVNGIISGTPTSVSGPMVDTVLATGPGGIGRAVVTLAVQDTAPRISYRQAGISGIKNVPVAPDTVVSSGGAVTGYAMSALTPLPAGLTLGPLTGIISGAATGVSGLAVDTIIATGPGGTGKAGVTLSVADTSPAFSYRHLSLSGAKNVSIVPDTVVMTGTGAITGYAMSVSTPLPAGLSLSGVTGVISGTPTAITAAQNDTIIASGPGGLGRAVVNIAVTDTAPRITYQSAALILTRNLAMAPDSAISTGGAVTHYSIAPALPANLILDTTTGVISGTPAVQSLSTNYAVTATGPGGTGTAGVNITVYSPPANLSYGDDPITYVLGILITPNTPTVTGIITHYQVNPAFPPGLSLDTLSGTISGTPTTRQSFATDYAVTASNPLGSTTDTVNITIVGAPSNLSYEDESPVYGLGSPITPPDIPTVHGIVTHYSITPALPAGIGFDITTGYIEGTPSAVSSDNVYTIVAQNPGGTSQTTITLGVILPPAE